MAYLGNDLTTIVKQGKKAYVYTATSGQTVFTGSDDNGESLDITVDGFVNVFLNGIRLIKTDDYTVSTDTITLTSGASLSDELVIVADIESAIYNTYTKSETDAAIVTGTSSYAPLSNPEFTGTYIKLPAGTTAQRPSSAAVGMLRYNTTLGFVEQYTDSGWQGIAPPPAITGVDVDNIDESASTQTIIISGTNFDTTATAALIDASANTLNPTTSVRNSSTQITITYSGGDVITSATAEPLSVRVYAGSGLTATLEDAINVDATPIWSTSVGNVGTVYEDQAISSITLTANDPEGSTVTYAISAGALPSGLSLSSSGVITGTPNVNDTYSASGVTHNFTVNASDGTGNITPRSFNIVRKWMDGTTETQAAPSGQAIADLGITNDGTFWIKPPGGTGTATQAYVMNSVHGGGWVKFIQYHNGIVLGSNTAAYNANAAWTSYRGSLNPGKLAHADIHALQANGTNTGFLMTVDSGENGTYQYWRYVEGSTTTGHHPRVSRFVLVDDQDNEYNMVVYMADNCVDQGTYQVGTSPTYNHGSKIRAKSVKAYTTTTAVRGANFTLQGSNDGSNWSDVFTGNMYAGGTCGIIEGNSITYSPAGNPHRDALFNLHNGIGGYYTSSGVLTNFGTDVDPTTTYDWRLDRTSNGTWDYTVTYTNDTQGRCAHAGAGSKVWYSDHNYNGSPGDINGIGMPICWSIGTQGIATNLHWMSQANWPNLNSGTPGQSAGEVYWGTDSVASAALWIK